MSPPRVLVIDDESSICQLLEALLSSAGLQVDTAMTQGDAFTRLGGGTYQVVLTDQNLPDGTGLDIIRRVRGESTANAVLMTGHNNLELTTEAVRAGAVDVFDKPFLDISKVLDRVVALCS